ncbi:unnamed protein product [Adineta steineri]|uniref:Uncharacterized protein n=1 Tax=Adineta steineri TaxID=433720 RepID=A0A818K6A5_9BILA|nr:unnamed protein product [Adineta steineri]CAF3554463.1 unnamed protein product [Adineta steineri]
MDFLDQPSTINNNNKKHLTNNTINEVPVHQQICRTQIHLTSKKPSTVNVTPRQRFNMSLFSKICPSLQKFQKSIPDYLMTSNPAFKQMIEQENNIVIYSIDIEVLRQIAILLHHDIVTGLEKYLWMTFLKYGTCILKTTHQSLIKYWPKILKLVVELTHNIHCSQEHILSEEMYTSLVQTYLYKLENRLRQYRIKVSEKTKHIHNYRIIIEPIIRTFTQLHLQSLYKEINYEINLLDYEYEDHRLDLAIRKENMNDNQIQQILNLYERTYEYEEIKQELILLKSLPVNEAILSSYIEIIPNQYIREQLLKRYNELICQYDIDMTHFLLTSTGTYMMDMKKLFEDEMEKFKQAQHALPIYGRFNCIVTDLIQQRLTNITKKIQVMYEYKKYRLCDQNFTN